jgi:hypothetical protein
MRAGDALPPCRDAIVRRAKPGIEVDGGADGATIASSGIGRRRGVRHESAATSPRSRGRVRLGAGL